MATSARSMADFARLNAAIDNVSSPLDVASRASGVIRQIQGTSQANSAFNAEQAAKNRDWQAQQNRIAMDFSAEEAAKNRDWQKMMSDTAHQREVKDLLAAGLNPVLSASGGNGAAVTSGATASGYTSSGSSASADTSANAAIVSLLGSLISSQTQLANTATSAVANLAVADKYNETSKYLGELQSQTSLSVANINRMASAYSAEVHADATKVAAAISAAAQRYGYDISSMTNKEIAAFNGEVNQRLKEMDISANFDLKEQQAYYDMIEKAYFQDILGSGISLGAFMDAIVTGENGSPNDFIQQIVRNGNPNSAKHSSSKIGKKFNYSDYFK